MADKEEQRRKRKSTRRSSILKMPRSPRSALSDVDQNVDSEEDNTVRRKSRRVSFAETHQVKEFLKDNGNGNRNNEIGQPTDPGQMLGSNVCTGNKVSTAGLATLLTGAIENEMPLSLHKQTSSCPEVSNKIDVNDFLSSLTGGSQSSSSHIQRIDPPILPERKYTSFRDDVFQNDNTDRLRYSHMDHTKIFNEGEDDQMDMTGVHGGGIKGIITTEQTSYSNVTWANETTKVFGKSALELYEHEERTKQMNFTQCIGGIVRTAGSIDTTLSQTPVSCHETLAGNRTTYFQNEEDEMELTGMNHQVSMMRKQDMSILACSDDFSTTSRQIEHKNVSRGKIDGKMFLAGLLSGTSDKKQDVGATKTEELMPNMKQLGEERLDGRSFLNNLMNQTASHHEDERETELNLRNKTTLLSESMDLTTCVTENLDMSNKYQNVGLMRENMAPKIDSQAFLANLVGQSVDQEIVVAQPLSERAGIVDKVETNAKNTHGIDTGSKLQSQTSMMAGSKSADRASQSHILDGDKLDTHLFLRNLMSEASAIGQVEQGNNCSVANKDPAEKVNANLFLRNMFQENKEEIQGSKDSNSKTEKSDTFKPDDSLSRKERKGLTDITQTYPYPEASLSNHTIYFNQENAIQTDDGLLENTECIGGILNSPTVSSNTTKSGNKTVCFNLEHTIHLVDKIVDSDQVHLEEVMAQVESRRREQNKTVHFADDSCLMEETACTGKLIASGGANSKHEEGEPEYSQPVENKDKDDESRTKESYGNSSMVMPGNSKTASNAVANKTVLFEGCPMEETLMTGVFKETIITNQNTVTNQNKSLLEENPVCNHVKVGGIDKMVFEKTKIFSDLNKTNGAFAMEETVCVGGLVSGEGQVTIGITKGKTDEKHDNKTQLTSEKTIIFSDLNKTGVMSMDETVCSGRDPEVFNVSNNSEKVEEGDELNRQPLPDTTDRIMATNKTILFDEYPMEETCVTGLLLNKSNVSQRLEPSVQKTNMYDQRRGCDLQLLDNHLQQPEKELLDKTKIFSKLDQTGGGFAIEETVCVGGLLDYQQHTLEEVSGNDKTIIEERKEPSAVVQSEFDVPFIKRMEEVICDDNAEAVDEIYSEMTKKSESTLWFGTMNKTAGLLDETHCIGGIISDDKLDIDKEELPSNVPGGLPNKTIIYSNLEKTSVGLMEETECIGKVLLCSDQSPSKGNELNVDVRKQGTETNMDKSRDSNETMEDLQHSEVSQLSDKRLSQRMNQNSVDSRDTKELDNECNKQRDGVNNRSLIQTGKDSPPPKMVTEKSTASANPLMTLKNRLKRISMGPEMLTLGLRVADIEESKMDTDQKPSNFTAADEEEEEVVEKTVAKGEDGDKLPGIADYVKDAYERVRHSSTASTSSRTQEGIMGEVLPDLECSEVKTDNSLISLQAVGDLTCEENKREVSEELLALKREASDSISVMPVKKVRLGSKEDDDLNKTGGSLNMTSASGATAKSFMGNLSTLLPKLSKANLSAASVREEYDLSHLSVESIDDYLRLFHVIFLDKSRRLSTMAPVSVCPAQNVSEALQFVVYEPQIQTYEWTCEQLINLIENCEKLTSESEARLLRNVPDILRNEPGHQESTEILGEMKSQCRKKALLNFKQCKAKMLKAISLALKEEAEGLKAGLEEIKEAESQIDSKLDYLDQAEAEIDAATSSLESASDIMNEIKDAQEKKSAVDLNCRSLEKERTELSVANDKLRETINKHKGKSEELNKEIERLGSQKKKSVYARLMNLYSISAFEVQSWDDTSGGQLSFLEGSLILKVGLGKALPQKWHSENPHRQITTIYLESKHNLDKTYGSMALQLGLNLMVQSYPKERLATECPDTTRLVQVLKQMSVLSAEVGQLVRDLSSHSLSLIHDTEYDLVNNRVTLKVSSLKAWTKFNLVLPLSGIQLPVTALPWQLHTVIGDVSEKMMQDLLDSVKPGCMYMKRFISTVLDFVNKQAT